MTQKYDHIIQGGTIVTMDAQYRILEEHFILIKNGRISAILPMEQISNYDAIHTTNATGCLVIPALINAHSHLPMTYFRGLADDLPLDKWLGDYIWPLENRMVGADFVYDATLHGAGEMLKNGICLTNDMYFHSDRIAQACSRAGMRVIVSSAIIAPDFDADPAIYEDKMLELQDFCDSIPLADCSLAPHALYTCSQKLLEACAEYARKHDWMLHTHLSESRSEVENCLKEHGKRPLDYLADLGFLEARCLFAHGVWLSGEECARLANTRSAIAVCTDSNLKLASGFAPLKSMIDHNVRWSLGSDGVASNNNLDLLEELSTTAKLHKCLNHDPQFLPARDAFARLTIEAAKALGKEDLLGSLEPGKAADIAIADIRNLQSSPLYNPYSQLVYTMGAHQMRDVMVAGEFAVKDHKLTRLDEADLLSQAQHYQQLMIQEMQK